MTLGDRKLEKEVLELFDRQAEQLLARMHAAEPAGLARLAHTLVGSARGIGAWRVAAAAEWPDTFTSRVEALALLQTLNAEILASRSATLTLANARDFKNGCGIAVLNAGPASTILLPSMRTVA